MASGFGEQKKNVKETANSLRRQQQQHYVRHIPIRRICKWNRHNSLFLLWYQCNGAAEEISWLKQNINNKDGRRKKWNAKEMELCNWSRLNTCLDSIQKRTDWCQCAEHLVSPSIALKRNWNSHRITVTHTDANTLAITMSSKRRKRDHNKRKDFCTNTVKKHTMIFIPWNRHGWRKRFCLSSLNRYKLWTMNFTFSWHKFCCLLFPRIQSLFLYSSVYRIWDKLERGWRE